MELTQRRLQLRHGGYVPIPLFGKEPPIYGRNNKRKGLSGWQSIEDVSCEQIELWGRIWPDARNTGILTKRTPALDVDVLNPDAAEAIEFLVKDKFGNDGSVMVRVGRPPRRAVLFQTDTPFRKFSVAFGNADKLEFLGHGQQLVGDGIHPDTGKPYRWHGGDPFTVTRAELPAISPEQAKALFDDCIDLLVREHAYTVETKAGGEHTPNPKNKVCSGIERLRDMVRVIPNDGGWESRNRVGMAIFSATGGSEDGFQIFERAGSAVAA